MLDYDKLLEFCEQDIEISSGILGHIFDTRKAYASLWEVPDKLYLSKYGLITRLLVNGYAVEVHLLSKASHILTKTRLGTLAGEKIKILEGDILEYIKPNLKLPISSESINKIKPCLEDPIKLVFNEILDKEDLGNRMNKIKQEYKQGLRGVGSRISKRNIQE
ncbi:MAG TPA: hypothetical protein VK203_00610 [Nostocaceae cyanobacterium]|nr:hypothetical protein [Nostocaceae cyanobacterium]